MLFIVTPGINGPHHGNDQQQPLPCRWKNGHCRFGDRCNFAHGEHELRKLPARGRGGHVRGTGRPTPAPGRGQMTSDKFQMDSAQPIVRISIFACAPAFLVLCGYVEWPDICPARVACFVWSTPDVKTSRLCKCRPPAVLRRAYTNPMAQVAPCRLGHMPPPTRMHLPMRPA